MDKGRRFSIKNIVSSKGENSQTFFNFLSTAITSGIALITMPIFTRMLGAEQFGLYSIYHAWLTIVVCFMGMNLFSSLGTGYYRFRDDYYKFKSSILVEGTVISIVIGAVLLLLYPVLKTITGYSFTLLVILLVHAFTNFIIGMANTGWVYEKQAARNMLLSATLLLSTSILSVVLLFIWDFDAPLYYGRVIGNVVPYILIGAVIWIVIFRKEPCGYNKTYWKYAIGFGAPMVFHLLSQQLLGQSDRLMMQWFSVDAGEIGIYSFFYSFVAILTTILNALNTSWCPFLYDDLRDENYEKLNTKIKNYVQIFTVLSLGFLLVSREVMMIFANSEYWSGAYLIPILVLVVYSTYFYQFGVNYEFFNERPYFVAIGTVVAAVSNIVLNYFMIPKWGSLGAAVATLVSYIILAVLHTAIVKLWKKRKRYPLSYTPVVVGLIIVAMGCALFYYMADMVLARWILAVALGIYLVYSVYRRKSIF